LYDLEKDVGGVELNEQKVRLGWVGCGRMGTAMAKRLVVAGNDVSVTNRTLAKADVLGGLGATVVESPRDLAACDIVFIMVSARRAC
jgi:3-hydroxyisobutyrate dehydrogenase-like beta-hydroxyacid dehydrogenase